MKCEEISERLMHDGSERVGILQCTMSRYVFASDYTVGRVALDVACGIGNGSDYLKRRGADVVIGGDLSTDAIEAGKNLYRANGVGYVLLDVTSMPFVENSFEVVVSFETLEHLEEHGKFLDECKRVLKHGGTFICSTPNREVSSYVAGKSVNPYHISEVTMREFENLLNKYFADVSLWGQDYWLRGNVIVKKLVSMLRSTIFRRYRFRRIFHSSARLLSAQFRLANSCDDHLDERHKPFPIRGSIKPAGLLALAKSRKCSSENLQFSVVIPTKDRIEDLFSCIEALICQTKKPKEIIVVDGGVTQCIEKEINCICEEARVPLKYIKQREGKFAHAKNLGIMKASGNVFLFVDDDVVLEKRYIEELENVYKKNIHRMGGVQGICTNIKVNPLENSFRRFFMMGHFGTESKLLPSGAMVIPISLSGVKKADGFVMSGTSFREEIFQYFKFDELYEYGDELNFSLRVSSAYDLYITPFAKFAHNLSPINRNVERARIGDTYAAYYIFCKIGRHTIRNKISFLLYVVGHFTGYFTRFISKPSDKNHDNLRGYTRGCLLILGDVLEIW